MRAFSKALLGLVGAASVAAASDVRELKADSFDDFIQGNDLVLAEFFAPWCGHCKALAPEYEEAATALKEKNIHLAKVDCTEEADLCQTQGVEGYPTLKVFRGLKNVSPYGGARKANAIISYMTKQSLPAVSTVTKDGLEDFKTADKVVVVAYFDPKDTKSNETFTSVATTLRDSYLFGAVTDPELAKAEGVKQPAVVLYKAFDEGKNVFQEKFTTAALEKFAKLSATPLIGEVGPETYGSYISAGIPLGYIFADTQSEREEFAKEFKAIAEKHKGKINLATIDSKAFGQHAQNLNLEVGKWPAFAIQDNDKNTKFPFDQSKTLTAKDIGQFVDDVLSGKIEPSIKSEPVPEKQDGPVTIIVAKNYNDIVLDDKKDVLVEFYAPWCGHCKALAPKYDELGSLFADFADKVVIAKVDATANDVPDEIQGFPTIKLFPAGKKSSPLEYSGARTVEDLAAFVRENGSNKIDVNDASAAKATVSSATEEMQHQAPAATQIAAKVVEKVAQVVEAAAGEGEGTDDHDEL